MSRLALPALLLVLASAAPPLLMAAPRVVTAAPARPDLQAQRRAVLALLKGAHPKISAQQLRQIGPDVERILRQAATAADRGAQPAVRALALLGHYNSPRTLTLLRRTLKNAELPLRLRRVAGSALLRSQGPAAVRDGRFMLSHADPFLREGAAIALGALPTPAITTLLNARMAVEKEAFVRDAIRTALGRHKSAQRAR